VGWVEQTPGELGFDVAVQESLCEVSEQLVTVQGVIGGRHAAAGDSRDRVHLVKQATPPALPLDVDRGELLQDAVGQRCGARAPT